MTTARNPRYWCANFDYNDVLDHGLRIDAWLVQYQYEHGGFEYQGNRRQKGRTTATWKSLSEVEIEDWLIAYLSGNTFFAVGQVVEPKQHEWQSGAAEHFDTIERTVREACHLSKGRGPDHPDFWPYAQRIDVEEWQHVVPHGLSVSGLVTAAPLPLYRKPLFPIDAEFFARVSDSLQSTYSAV